MGTAIRLLRAEEIECRVGTINEKGVSLLLFKDARVDQRILDEAFTPFGWQRSHQVLDGNLYCTVTVWDEAKKQWISKQDVGTMSFTEKEKSQASDSFKRACFNWGIGRELYTAPFIWIPAERARIKKRGDKLYCEERFRVREIHFSEDRAISYLVIVNGSGQEVYRLGMCQAGAAGVSTEGLQAASPAAGTRTTEIPAAETQAAGLRTAGLPSAEAPAAKGPGSRQMSALEKELERTGVSLDQVLERYRISSVEQMTESIYTSAMKDLKKSKNRRIA